MLTRVEARRRRRSTSAASTIRSRVSGVRVGLAASAAARGGHVARHEQHSRYTNSVRVSTRTLRRLPLHGRVRGSRFPLDRTCWDGGSAREHVDRSGCGGRRPGRGGAIDRPGGRVRGRRAGELRARPAVQGRGVLRRGGERRLRGQRRPAGLRRLHQLRGVGVRHRRHARLDGGGPRHVRAAVRRQELHRRGHRSAVRARGRRRAVRRPRRDRTTAPPRCASAPPRRRAGATRSPPRLPPASGAERQPGRIPTRGCRRAWPATARAARCRSAAARAVRVALARRRRAPGGGSGPAGAHPRGPHRLGLAGRRGRSRRAPTGGRWCGSAPARRGG